MTKVSARKVTHAAVGIMQQTDDQVLLAERPVGKPWSGYWEFPGGKVEVGETAAQALCRELKEELGITVTTLYPWITRTFDYPAKYDAGTMVSEAKTVKLSFFIVTQWHGEPRGLENQTLCWQSPTNLQVTPMLPANAPIFSALQLPKNVLFICLSLFDDATSVLSKLQSALDDGMRMFIVRCSAYDQNVVNQLLEIMMAMAKRHAAKIIVEQCGLNADLVVDGLHLNTEMLHQVVKKAEYPIIGATCHDVNDLNQAVKLNLDYVIFSMPNKAVDQGELDWLAFTHTISEYAIPIYVFGKVTQQNLVEARMHGAHGLVEWSS